MLSQRQISSETTRRKALLTAACFADAIENKNLTRVEQLIADGEDVDAENSMGQTALEIAFLLLAKNPNDAKAKCMIDALVSAGADPNHCNAFTVPLYARIMREGSYYCTQNYTICHHCTKLQSVIPRLIHAGANLNKQDGKHDGNNALHVAARMSMYLIQFLKEYRIDVNAQNDRGETPLMIACDSLADNFHSAVRVISHLRAAGANAELLDINGESALDRIKKHRLTARHKKENARLYIDDEDWDAFINYLTQFNNTDFHVNAIRQDIAIGKIVALDHPAVPTEELELIARSSKNNVYKSTFFKKTVAVKVGNPIFGKKDEMINEIKILTHLTTAAKESPQDAKYVVKYFGATAVRPDNSIGIVLELAMPLLDHVQRHPSFRVSFRLMANIIAALAFLHKNDIVHHDISLGNMLVRIPESNSAEDELYANAILTDFSNSKMVADLPDKKLSSRYSNRSFAAPECKANPPTCSAASDVYTLAKVFSHMLFHQVIPLRNIKHHKQSSTHPIHTDLNNANCPSYFLEVLSRSTQADPAARPTAEQLKVYMTSKMQ